MNERVEKLLEFFAATPQDDFAPYALAQEYLAAGKTEEALGWIAKTLAIRPDHAYAYYQKARALELDDREDEALAAIDEGLAAAERAGDAKAREELKELRETLE